MVRRALASLAAAGLLLLAFILMMGAIKLFNHPEPGGSAADWIGPGILAVPCAAGAVYIAWRLRTPLTRDLLLWPSVQAFVLYVAASPLMLALHSFAHAVAFFALCAFCLSAPLGALLRPRWTTTALSAVVWCLLLFGALEQTAEAIGGDALGEGAMVYLLPFEAMPVLLGVVGLVRLVRKAPATQP
jgi:hypothetical protein